MSLSLAIAIVALADLAVIAGLAFAMTRARLLTPHGLSVAAAPSRSVQTRRRPRTASRVATPAHARA